ncbi:MAG: ATP-binding protein [Minicystis sp.]
MMLRSIDFIQSEGTPLEWRLSGLTLRQINLIVGKNACGKSKALDAIGELAELVSGSRRLDPAREQDISCVARFDHGAGGAETVYSFKVVGSRVVRENLRIGAEDKVERGAGGAGRIYFDKLSRFLEFQSPEDDLACVSRRDSIQHPYLEALNGWGRGSHHYRFNSLDLGKHSVFSASATMKLEGEANGRRASLLPVQYVYLAGITRLGDAFRASILADMRKIGYPLQRISFMLFDRAQRQVLQKDVGEDLVCLCVDEDGVGNAIDQFAMSDGMFRTLAILIHVTYAAMIGKPSCVVIDDVGEGLDYERSCLLIELLIEKAQKTGVQIIMATNDRFVMNNVPLEHWTILNRERTERGTRVEVYNYETHKKVFDAFAYTGLNNFDFFATRFFEEGVGERA